MGNLILRGCKTIAEYAFRRWMREQGFAEKYFSLEMEGNTGILKDNNGDTLTLVYDATEKCVYVKEREYVQI